MAVTTPTTQIVPAERAVWQRPEVHRIEAGEAEGAVNTGTDAVVFS